MTVQHHPRLHRDLLRLQRGLHVRLVLCDDLLDVCVEVDIEPLRALLDLQSEERGGVLRQRDVKVPGDGVQSASSKRQGLGFS